MYVNMFVDEISIDIIKNILKLLEMTLLTISIPLECLNTYVCLSIMFVKHFPFIFAFYLIMDIVILVITACSAVS